MYRIKGRKSKDSLREEAIIFCPFFVLCFRIFFKKKTKSIYQLRDKTEWRETEDWSLNKMKYSTVKLENQGSEMKHKS